jgi:hypothetical protein
MAESDACPRPTAESHVEWTKDICSSQGVPELGFPIIADENRDIITELGMIDPEEKNAAGLPMPARVRLGRIFALYHRSSTLYHNHEHIRHLFF